MKKISNYSIRITIGLVITIVLILNLGQGITKGIQIIEKNERDLSLFSLTPHDPISITSDSDFEVFPGTGTADDPYIIEGYNITTAYYHGIYIYDTTKYFIVRNCNVEASYYGIYINNVAYRRATVMNNTCNNNGYYGIYLSFSVSSTVVNNTCSNNNDYGIFFSRSGSSTMTNNTFTNCGLDIFEFTIDEYLSYSIENNWVNGKKLGFYTNLDSTIIAEPVYGQLLLVNCTNVTVRDQILNNASNGLFFYSCTYSVIISNTCGNNGNYGIYLWYSGSSTVTNNTCNNGGFGIYLRSSGGSTVVNNTCSNNNHSGIYLWSSVSSTLANNTCNNGGFGICLEDSGSSTLANNTCNDNLCGIHLYDSGSSTLANNTCNDNLCGIHPQISGSSTLANNTCSNNGDDGIYLFHSGGSTLANNTCNNNCRGIYLEYSDFCVVTYNLLQENTEYGVYLISGSDNNIIHHNNFVDNKLGGTSQAIDNGTNNIWYDPATLEGNYWSDWSGIGNYSIDGSAGTFDLYPLGVPLIAEYPQIVLLTLLLSIVPLFLIRTISKKVKKK